jgi:hypothetical protein
VARLLGRVGSVQHDGFQMLRTGKGDAVGEDLPPMTQCANSVQNFSEGASDIQKANLQKTKSCAFNDISSTALFGYR